ncbi:6-phosphogluconolactonase [Candidatus Bipolaricaulota bacterium]|nr:6-phosphogluconolactonase [Candidatus Bipolaricaulota bacterium]
MKWVVCPSLDALSRHAADIFVRRCQDAIERRGEFVVALSGGQTPTALFRRLVEPDRAARVDWPAVHVVWADERCVPPEDEASNYRSAREVLLSHVPIPAGNVHRIEGEWPPMEAADTYEHFLHRLLGSDGRLDLALLGMGTDGHTASLFPGHRALDEICRWVVAAETDAAPPWRVTLTLPVLNAARCALFLVAGVEKANAVRRVQAGEDLPASRISPTEGELIWLVDRDAART